MLKTKQRRANDPAMSAAVIAAIFTALGVVGTLRVVGEEVDQLRFENAALRSNRGCTTEPGAEKIPAAQPINEPAQQATT